MEQKVGISLCVCGTATRIVGSRLCHVKRGLATIITPLLPTVELERSEDYRECVVTEDADRVMAETTPYFSQMVPAVNDSLPCIVLDEDAVGYVVDIDRRIADREAVQPETEIFRQMYNRLTTILRLQVILEVLYRMASTSHPVAEKPSRSERVFVGFMQSLARHYAERRTVADYAAEASLSVRHFSTLVHQHTGRTPMQWIHLFVIGQARHLLLQSDLQIKEIADRLGFPEQFTFRKYFKTHTGMSPSECRRMGNLPTRHAIAMQ